MSERVSERMSEQVSERMSERVSERMSVSLCHSLCALCARTCSRPRRDTGHRAEHGHDVLREASHRLGGGRRTRADGGQGALRQV
eukprot:4532828-Pleurochrysis_carterae.AAC.1